MDAQITATEFARHLTDRFRWIGDNRMSDLPIYHHGLDVEAVGFEATDEGWFGVLITPWFMNAMLFPLEPESLDTLELGTRVSGHLPSGEHTFMIGEDEELGRYKFIPLASPMLGYSGQEAAREAAKSELVKLLTPPSDNPDMIAPAAPVQFAQNQADEPENSDRRAFFGRFGGKGEDNS
jgi:[NiFe] hydrogenase assembly HybE family chaperone